jgi:hypothetical protein
MPTRWCQLGARLANDVRRPRTTRRSSFRFRTVLQKETAVRSIEGPEEGRTVLEICRRVVGAEVIVRVLSNAQGTKWEISVTTPSRS